MWYLEKVGASSTRVNLTVNAGDIVENEVLPAAVYESISGARTVWQSPAMKKQFSIPELVFTSATEVERFRNLVKSGAKLTFVTNYGRTYTVRAIGTIQVKLLDTPDQATKPQFRVPGLQLVEV